MHWFWGDERFVPHDHPDSNYRMVHQALFSEVPVPEANIHAIPTVGLTPEQAATAYEATLKEFYGGDALDPRRPLFDVTLLEIGEDGHIASLFPGQPALRERHRWVVAVEGRASEPRITLTYPHSTAVPTSPFSRPEKRNAKPWHAQSPGTARHRRLW